MTRLSETLLVLCLVTACTAIVPDEITIGCTDEGQVGPPACYEGARCLGGKCVEEDTDFCCASEDCGPLKVCTVVEVEETGGGPTTSVSRACILADHLDRPIPGDLSAGEPCEEAADCRSGSCFNGGCIDTCCSDSDCPVRCVDGVCLE